MLRFLKLPHGLSFFIDRVIPKEGLYTYNMHNIVEKRFSINIVPVRSQGGLLVLSNLHTRKHNVKAFGLQF
jgi:hypothetical protein